LIVTMAPIQSQLGTCRAKGERRLPMGRAWPQNQTRGIAAKGSYRLSTTWERTNG